MSVIYRIRFSLQTGREQPLSWMVRRRYARIIRIILLIVLAWPLEACSTKNTQATGRAERGEVIEGTCQLPSNLGEPASAIDAGNADASASTADVPNYLSSIGCTSDFEAMASLPLDVTIPGARSMKFVIDTQDQKEPDHLYFQNSERYPLHKTFVADNIIPRFAGDFNNNYYGDQNRRFRLGAITHYEQPDIWALELAPYDTSNATMIKMMFDTITKDKAFFRPGLAFHPTSDALNEAAKLLDLSIPVVTTDDIYAKTDYQPLTRASAMGVLTFLTAAEVYSGAFIPYNSIVVLDEAPNDISVVAGIITEQFQSPLSHINVLATNRKTPNMGLRNAKSNPAVLNYKDQWVQLTVAADKFSIDPVDPAVGQATFDASRPPPVTLPEPDLTETRIQDIEALVPNFDPTVDQKTARAAILKAVQAYGGKSANYSVLAQVPGVPVAKAFAIPLYYYDKFMKDNGLYDMIDSFLSDDNFNNNPTVREESLRDLRNAMMKGDVDQDLQDQLRVRFARDFTGTDGKPIIMRLRTSTNSEDLAGFPCAGCYNSQSGDPANWQTVLDGIKMAYSTAWLFRTFEERSYYRVDHKKVGMGLLVHHKYINETANGVAITANPYDLTQSDATAYLINTAYGGVNSVVALPPGVTSDQLLYFVGNPGNNINYLQQTNQPLPAGSEHVLTAKQIATLGTALTLVNNAFRKAYTDQTSGWYAMDVEFKFCAVDYYGNITDTPTLWLKQARSYPNPNASAGN